VKEFKCKFLKAGEASSADARAQITYVATMEDGNSFSGGMVLSNLMYDEAIMGPVGTPTEYDIKTVPAAFDLPTGP